MAFMVGKGATTSHGGTIDQNPAGDPRYKAEGKETLVDGCSFVCPIHPAPGGGGRYSFTATGHAKSSSTKVLLEGDIAGCGAAAITNLSVTKSE